MAWTICESHAISAYKIWVLYHQVKTEIPLFEVLDGEENTSFNKYHYLMRKEYNKFRHWGKEAVKKLLRDYISKVTGFTSRSGKKSIENYTYKEYNILLSEVDSWV